MKRRVFLSALAATFAAPAQILSPAKPTVLGVDWAAVPDSTAGDWVATKDYVAIVHPYFARDLAAAGALGQLLNFEIGRYEGVRFIESRALA